MISRENMQALKMIPIFTHASNTLGRFTQSSIKLLKNAKKNTFMVKFEATFFKNIYSIYGSLQTAHCTKAFAHKYETLMNKSYIHTSKLKLQNNSQCCASGVKLLI